ncbi:hypothetical protein [Corynebacterium pseudodiphtheriticum]|uniref:hypothetical protein n=1 Tax=Corynebacterium pseudodiphtheriticum TaxID=37637 RepID=UPI0020C0D0E8|nr:hypothetical protein [Corynebacterium pseudodiphtheriticum]UQV53641.1 hypothetical protein L2D23_07740 [Corynebacterium pseudodiphtheriticum]
MVSTIDFDMKREPLFDDGHSTTVHGYELFNFPTRAWDSVGSYLRGRQIARHIQMVKPGTAGMKPRPTGCLRTEDDWRNWYRRHTSKVHRRIRTADAALLTEIVAACKAGLVDVPELTSKRLTVKDKLLWLSSLGLGDFSRNQWDHMSKLDRRCAVLADCDLDEVRAFLDSLEGDAA